MRKIPDLHRTEPDDAVHRFPAGNQKGDEPPEEKGDLEANPADTEPLYALVVGVGHHRRGCNRSDRGGIADSICRDPGDPGITGIKRAHSKPGKACALTKTTKTIIEESEGNVK